MDGHERRLRGLIDAVVGVGEGLDLPMVLQRIVTTACELTGARYGALGVQDGTGAIVEFYSHGVDPQVRAGLGDRPHGLGLPGLLLAPQSAPLRISRLASHPRFAGFPAGHPPMDAFLGVPIRVKDTTFGNLYVADPQRDGEDAAGTFTAEDEDALRALAAAAGVAVGNARLFEDVRRRQVWLQAATEAVQAVVDPDVPDLGTALDRVARVTGAAAGARAVTVHLAEPDGLRLAARWEAVPGSLPDEEPSPGVPQAADELRLPLTLAGGDLGLLRLVGVRRDGDADPVLAQTFADRLALAIEASRAASDRAALALLRDRDRIARDLHDLVIQRLFAVGLSLQAAGNVARVPEVAARLARAVDDLDDTIKDVRRTIFQLHGTAVRSPLRDELEEIVATAREDLGIAVRLVVEGPILAVPDHLGPDLLAVVREALSNVAKHADATSVLVGLRIGRSLELEVSDDGVGMTTGPDGGRRSGLANVEQRAAGHDGTLRVRSAPGAGTTLTWTVPRSSPGRR